MLSPYLAAPPVMIVGLYLLVRCVAALRRLIFPAVRHRFQASAEPYRFSLPEAGRYIVNVVIPPLTILTGTGHFAARFDIACWPSRLPLVYRPHGRLRFRVMRSNMSGQMAMPLGTFHCPEPGAFEIRCLNPDSIRSTFQLEISPYVPPLLLVVLVLSTILSFAMTVGGLIFSLMGLAA